MSEGFNSRREPTIEFSHFLGVELRVGRVRSTRLNPKAQRPAYVMEVDFGDALGVKTTSAQVTTNYTADALVGRLVIAVMNFPPKRVAGVKSEVLVLAAVDDTAGTVLLSPERDVALGTRVL
jgi:tRNA-binding protein